MSLPRPPLTEGEKQKRGEGSLRWWAEHPEEREIRRQRRIQYNKTRVFSEEVKQRARERLIHQNKTRIYSAEERKQASERMSRLRKSGVIQRGPMTEQEKEAHRQRATVSNPMRDPNIRMKMRESIIANKEAMMRATERMRKRNPMFNPISVTAMRQTLAQRHGERLALLFRWYHLSGRIGQGFTHPALNRRPTRPEALLIPLLEPLGFRYTGNRAFWVGPCKSGQRRNPDFIWKTGRHKIALLYNGTYWHERHGEDAIEIGDYESKGWQVFVVTEVAMEDTEAIVAAVSTWLVGLGFNPSPQGRPLRSMI